MKRKLYMLATAAASTIVMPQTFAQTAISSANTAYIQATTGKTYTDNGAPASGYSGDTYNYKYGTQSGTTSNNLQLNGFSAGGATYVYTSIAGSYVKMRRVDNAVVTGVRNLKFEEGTINNSTIKIAPAYNDDMESFFSGNKSFNSGTDNLFGNQGDGNGNNNNIERLDVIFPAGYLPADNAKAGFAVFERGATNAHDGVKVALILAINGSGLPTSYSSIVTVTSANYGPDVVAGKDYIIDRRDNAAETHLKVSTTTNQPIGGIMFKYSDFGITQGTQVYGYSVIPNDFTGTAADLVDYTNAAHFPTNTSSNTGAGGIDLVSVTGMVVATATLPLTLLSFDADAADKQVMLGWKTAQEKDIRTTEIEQSINGTDWHRIGNAAPDGSNSYTFTDVSPVQGLNFYRLRFIDLDGSFTLSPVRTARINQPVNTAVTIAPNPATNYTNVILSGQLNGSTVLAVFNTAGQMVANHNISGSGTVSLELGNYQPGIYYITIINEGSIIYRSALLKQ